MNKCEVSINRNNEGKIDDYKVIAYRKDKSAFITTLSREDSETIFGLYTYYGGNITARNVANEFPKYTLSEIKYIFKAFGLTKDAFWAPQHLLEELTKEELCEYRLNLKEKAAFKYADSRQEQDFKNLLNKIASENLNLKKKLSSFSDFKIKVPKNFDPIKLPEYEEVGQGVNLYLSDIHLGASVVPGTLYKDNINYGFNEAKRRLEVVLQRLYTFGDMDFVNICLMGDNIDCCGFTGLTARRDHVMPENMEARDQANKYIELILWFIKTIIDSNSVSKINVYSVPCGNHAGNYEYIVTKALFSAIKVVFPNVNTELFEQFYGHFKVNNSTFVLTHGKDAQFCKKGLPLNLNDKTKNQIYEYLDSQGITGENIHVIKGDLHSNNLDGCKRFDYRNVLSLFGASDYSALNFTAQSYGLSYDFFIGDNIMHGTFENL